MGIRAVANSYPFLTYGALCVVSGGLLFWLASLGSYDDGGIGSVALLLLLVWAVVAFPFSVPLELFGTFTASLAFGFGACAVFEWVYSLWRRRAPN